MSMQQNPEDIDKQMEGMTAEEKFEFVYKELMRANSSLPKNISKEVLNQPPAKKKRSKIAAPRSSRRVETTGPAHEEEEAVEYAITRESFIEKPIQFEPTNWNGKEN